MNGSTSHGGSSTNNERVTFVVDEERPDRFIPQVYTAQETRVFEPEDMPRVLDYDNVIESPPDAGLKMGDEHPETGHMTFPVQHICLRGHYIFYFDPEDVDDTSGPYVTYHKSPVGVIPLEHCRIEYPPGGRRVFREHAQTDAKNGYELVILHDPVVEKDEDGNLLPSSQPRPPAFIVCDSLGKREKWANAMRSRAEQNAPTMLRAGYSSSTARRGQHPTASNTATAQAAVAATKKEDKATTSTSVRSAATPTKESAASAVVSSSSKKSKKSIQQQVMEVSDDAELASAVVEFGVPQFDEHEWLNHYFSVTDDREAGPKCTQMEQWQTELKRDLKGAVLEQYEYFVQASGEMTTMGKEVANLKALIERQVIVLKDMKNIDFKTGQEYGRDELMGREDDDDDNGSAALDERIARDEQNFFSDMSSLDDGTTQTDIHSKKDQEEDNDFPPIEIPVWLQTVASDLGGHLHESRYHDAIELLVKARAELADILDKHERPTAHRLTNTQKDVLRQTRKELSTLSNRLAARLSEALRRKNEALRQAFKRERADVSAALAPPISPCALLDDALYLQYLVKMGRNQEAAEAYAARRSLLLLETLNERPIAGAGTVDLVIYAAQLSQSFFACMAGSVEGFLDLFLTPSDTKSEEDAASLDASSLHSSSIHGKNLPAGAIASLVLWCDSELSKFANAFGGARVLSNLALSPPPRPDAPKGPRVVGDSSKDNLQKERNNALQVAAQCIDQAFLYASRNLDSVGLPLTPRLSECIRSRLKGCEAEVSLLLDDRWRHLTAEWRASAEAEENGHFM